MEPSWNDNAAGMIPGLMGLLLQMVASLNTRVPTDFPVKKVRRSCHGVRDD